MTTLHEAAQQALEALAEHGAAYMHHEAEYRKAITTLKAALAEPNRAQAMRDAGYTRRPTLREMADSEQPEQEPVSTWYGTDWPAHMQLMAQLAHLEPGTDLYTHPPRREWQSLTEEEIQSIHDTYHKRMGPQEFARAIEAALRSKNHE